MQCPILVNRSSQFIRFDTNFNEGGYCFSPTYVVISLLMCGILRSTSIHRIHCLDIKKWCVKIVRNTVTWHIVKHESHEPWASIKVIKYYDQSIVCLGGSNFRMMTSSNGNIFRVTGPFCGQFTGQMETSSALLALSVGNSPVAGEFPSQRTVTRSFDVSFDPCLNKRLSKKSRRRWFETLLRSLWRHCNGWIVGPQRFGNVRELSKSYKWIFTISCPSNHNMHIDSTLRNIGRDGFFYWQGLVKLAQK